MNALVALSGFPLLLVAFAAGDANAASASDSARFEPREVKVGGVTRRYAAWLPPGFDTNKAKWPAIVFLHGSGESGTDGEKPIKIGLGPALQAHPERWPFVVLFAQKPTADEEWWEHEKLVFAILDDASKHLRVDRKRVALAGMSQGGHGTWMIGARHPDRWRCLVPVCGYGRAQTVATRLRRMPIWCFQGMKDDVVLPHETQEIVRWLREFERNEGIDSTLVRATFFPDANHNSWDPAFATEELPAWIVKRTAK